MAICRKLRFFLAKYMAAAIQINEVSPLKKVTTTRIEESMIVRSVAFSMCSLAYVSNIRLKIRMFRKIIESNPTIEATPIREMHFNKVELSGFILREEKRARVKVKKASN